MTCRSHADSSLLGSLRLDSVLRFALPKRNVPSVYCFTFFVSAVKNRFDLFLAWLPLPVFHGPSGFGLLTKDCDRSQTFSTRQTRQLRDSALDANFPLNTRARRARKAGERLRPRGARSPGLAGDAGEEGTQGPKVARKVSPRLPPPPERTKRCAESGGAPAGFQPGSLLIPMVSPAVSDPKLSSRTVLRKRCRQYSICPSWAC